MKIIEFSQGSSDWLAWRKSRITATDASIITGANPFKTRKQLWEEKLEISPPQPVNDRMLRGQELEPIARNLFIERTGIDFIPIVCEHDIDSWHGSSLDGYSEKENILLEVKCPSWSTHQLALFYKDIPFYYQHQMQHQFYTSGSLSGYYVSYFPDAIREDWKLAILKVFPDKKFIEYLTNLEKIFYSKNLCTMEVPADDWLEKLT